ncbi:MAG TPA: BMP family ABC transporter substrate-binding protein [Jatrophihabitans sp.]|jgi:basic membrane protein A|uniref:BMP family lipoprotein n=1 Tax=Jatrophihabitans sp. TaxID=1932789 RepID=UPI002DFAFD0F|nr:BMP family ABC transporter substrate-binding protein [Jatrophihabitans sp.]
MIALRVIRTGVVVAACAATALSMAACGSKAKSGGSSTSAGGTSATSSASAPATTSSSAAAGGALNACMVLDTGGVDDKSFNQSSYAGLQAAAQANPKIKISYVPSNSGNDYTPNLTAETQKGCQAIVAVGGLMFDNVTKVAKANPKSHYAEVDAGSSGPNVYGLQFNTAQGAFLGGYLAAGMTKTGSVATWGGLNIPPVTIYMDGFWEGVQYYNAQNKKKVQVLGWDEKSPKKGTFSQSFTDQNKGKQISQTFIQQGADIIFPVAGGAGVGAATAAQASGGKANAIWVDTDGCVSVAQYCKYFLTSVTKNLADSVQKYVEAAATGTFPTGSYIGNLSNNGTGLAPFHDFDAKVPASLKSQLDTVKQDIISGKIKITSPSQPK